MSITIVTCPEPGCGAPAEVTDAHALGSTDGDVVMVRLIGSCGHHFVMPHSWLDIADPAIAVHVTRSRHGHV